MDDTQIDGGGSLRLRNWYRERNDPKRFRCPTAS